MASNIHHVCVQYVFAYVCIYLYMIRTHTFTRGITLQYVTYVRSSDRLSLAIDLLYIYTTYMHLHILCFIYTLHRWIYIHAYMHASDNLKLPIPLLYIYITLCTSHYAKDHIHNTHTSDSLRSPISLRSRRDNNPARELLYIWRPYWLYVCIYVCMHVCVLRICMVITTPRESSCTSGDLIGCVYVCMYVCMYVYTCMYVICPN